MTQMADILLPLSPEPDYLLWVVLWGLIILVIFLWLLWRYLTQPLQRLQRRLRQGQVAVRDAAHQLAHLLPPEHDLQHEIDQLRFQRRRPEATELLVLINKVKHGR